MCRKRGISPLIVLSAFKVLCHRATGTIITSVAFTAGAPLTWLPDHRSERDGGHNCHSRTVLTRGNVLTWKNLEIVPGGEAWLSYSVKNE